MFGQNCCRLFYSATCIVACLIGSTAMGHEGHGHNPGQGATPTHYLTEPLHVMQFAAIALAVFAIGWFSLRWYIFGSRSDAKKIA